MSHLRNLLLDRHDGKLPEGALAAACLLVCRSGQAAFDPGEVATAAELEALAAAQEELVKEHLALQVLYFWKRSIAFRQFDGGAYERAEVMAAAWAKVGL